MPPRDDLAERIDGMRFWTYFGSAASVLAAVIAIIALIVAIGASSDDQTSTARLQRQLDRLERRTGGGADVEAQVERLAARVAQLEEDSAAGQGDEDLAGRIDRLQEQLSDLLNQLGEGDGGDGGIPGIPGL